MRKLYEGYLMKKVVLIVSMLCLVACKKEYNAKDLNCVLIGQPSMSCTDKNNKPVTGKVIFPEGKSKMETMMTNGNIDSVKLFENGELVGEASFKYGKADGSAKLM